MDPVSLALTTIPTAMQAGTGVYQLIRGNQLSNSIDRPEYSIPQEVLDKLTDAQIQALRGLPAQQRKQYLDNIMRSAQSSIAALNDRKSGLSGISAVQQNMNDAYRNLMTMDAQARMEAEQRLQSVRSEVADYRDKEFEFNEANPYFETMRAAEAMKGAGLQNIMKGAKSGTQMGLDYKRYNDLLNSFGEQSGESSPQVDAQVNQINATPSGNFESMPQTLSSTNSVMMNQPSYSGDRPFGIYGLFGNRLDQ